MGPSQLTRIQTYYLTMDRRIFIQTLAATTYGVKAYDTKPVESVKAKNIIYIYLDGGMSHIDTFDPKDLADIKGDTEKINTTGDFQISHRLPKLAKVMEHAAVVRGTTSKTGAHAQAQYLNRTSFKPIGTITHPSIGAWIDHVADRKKTIPDYVLIDGSSSHPGAGFLPMAECAPLPIVDPRSGVKNTKKDDKLAARMAMLREVNSRINSPIANTYNEFYESTVKFLNSKELELFDIYKESKETRERYGESKLGQGLLLAKRMVQADTKFIEVNNNAWDMHNDIAENLDKKLTELDTGVSALVEDLKSEGKLDTTLIVIATDFGRTPNINANSGRDHHPKAYSTVLIGAGIKGGITVGESDEKGNDVVGDSYTIADINATVAKLAGLEPYKEHLSPTGRPFKVADKGKVIEDLIA